MIFKSKIARLSVTAILFLCTLWIITPKVYIHKLLGHHHTIVTPNGETSVQAESNSDCDFDKYDSPVYFTIFKFINNFIPIKPKQQSVLIPPVSDYNSFILDSGASRAPPLV